MRIPQSVFDAELELARQAADGVSGLDARRMAMRIEIVERRKKEIEAKKLVHLDKPQNLLTPDWSL